MCCSTPWLAQQIWLTVLMILHNVLSSGGHHSDGDIDHQVDMPETPVCCRGFALPARRVRHTVGPIYHQYSKQEAASHLANAHKYVSALLRDFLMAGVYTKIPLLYCMR